MVMGWIAEHRRNRILEQPFPAPWEEIFARRAAFYSRLTPDEQKRLRDTVQILVHEKSWEGGSGLAVTDEMRVTISAYAALLTVNREHDYYANVESIIIYATDYHVKEHRSEAGVVDESRSDRLGEAWLHGPVVLSWQDVEIGSGNNNDGQNVVIHEFAHKLDMNDDEANGVPYLDDDKQVEEWAEVMQQEYNRLIEEIERGHGHLLRAYGATNPAEFFAVACECFFEKSLQMERRLPRLYRTLQGYFHQDPAARADEQEASGEE